MTRQPTAKRQITSRVLLAGILLCTWSTTNLAAAGGGVVYVKADAKGSQDGTSWDNAFTSLQDALDDGKPGQQIWVAEGLYLPDDGAGVESGDRDASFAIPDDLSLFGGFAGNEKHRLICAGDPEDAEPCQTDDDCGDGQCIDVRNPALHTSILSGDLAGNDDPEEFPDGASYADNSLHVVVATGTTPKTRIDGFQITGGNANHSDLPNNRGGGLRVAFGSPVVADCTFVRNQATSSGGAVFTGIGDTTLVMCTFVQNATTSSSGRGGAVSGSLSRLRLINCAFFGNTAGQSGGAVYGNLLTDPALEGCVFSGNQAVNGGALLSEFASNPLITNCSFGNNTATALGGGLYLDGENSLVRNSVFWQNADQNGTDAAAQIYVESGTADVAYSIVQGGWTGKGEQVLSDDPLFTDPAGPDTIIGTTDDDLRPLPGSPAIDAGDTTALPPDDFDLDNDGDTIELLPNDAEGNTRVLDDPATEDTGLALAETVDMGAYELIQDCNLNGIPDYLEIEQGSTEDADNDGIPDECGFWTDGCPDNSNWSCFDNWDLPGEIYPDNTDSSSFDVVIGNGAMVLLDVDVIINTLLLEGASLDITDPQRMMDVIEEGIVNNGTILLDNDAALNVCCGGITNSDALFVGGGGADPDPELLIQGPAGLHNTGSVVADSNALMVIDGGGIRNLGTMLLTDTTLDVLDTIGVNTNGPVLVAESNNVSMPVSELLIGTSGLYEKNAESMIWTDAALATDTVLITNADTEELCPPLCGQPTMILSNSMSAATNGDFVLDGSATPEGAVTNLGIAPPPKLVSTDTSTLEIGGDLIIIGDAELDLMSAAAAVGPSTHTVLLLGSLINQSTAPALFEWISPLRMGPSGPQSFEVASEDFGASLDGFQHPDAHSNFSMTSIEIAENADVAFRNDFANLVGNEPLDEVLYVEQLNLGARSTVLIDGCKIYYVELNDEGANLLFANGGTLVAIPTVPQSVHAEDVIDITGQVQACSADEDCPNVSICRSDYCYVPKQRYVSVRANPENAGVLTARRVALESEGSEPEVLGWIAEPELVQLYGPGADSALLARLQDEPFFTDWGLQPLSVTQVGACEISPGHTYLVQSITLGLDPADEQSYAPALALPTAPVFGDCCGGGETQTPPDGRVNFVDIQAAVAGFQFLQAAPRSWLDLVSYFSPNPALINYADIQLFVVAFKSGSYNGPAPLECP